MVIKNFVNQSLNLASVPLPKVLPFIFTEKGTSSMQASQGLRISIKDCCNFERISGLAFSIFTGDQTFLQWTNKRVIVSIITNPRAWSKTMGIATIVVVVIYIKEDLKPLTRVFEKTTGPISHFLASFEPCSRSSGYRLSKMSNFWSCIDLGHILKNRALTPIAP